MDYSDIINLPHPTSTRHPRMTMYQRAAQFAPFSALTGHNEAIRDTASIHTENSMDQELFNAMGYDE